MRALPTVAIVGAGLLLPAGVAWAATADPVSAPASSTVNAATSTLVSMTIDNVPSLKLRAFHGTEGTSAVAQNDGDDAADTARDPAGVLQYVTVGGSAQSKTHSDSAKNWARAQLAPAYSLHGKQIYSIGSLESYADCTSAYVHEDAVTVLGTTIPAGKTTTVSVTGAQIGVHRVDHGTLDVTYTTTAASTHAYLDLSLAGSFYNSAGKKVYSGPLQKVRFGDVQVSCPSTTPTSPGQSTAPTSQTPPPTSPTGAAEANDPAAAGSGNSDGNPAAALEPPAPNAPADSPDPSAEGAAAPRHQAHHAARPHGGSSSGPTAPGHSSMQRAAKTAALPHTSDISVWWMVLSGLGLGGGILLYFATRRRGGHQQ